MGDIRQKSWFSITVFVVSSLSVLTLILFIANTYFPSQSSDLVPRRPDRITRWLFNSESQQTASVHTAQQDKLFFRLNQKKAAGKSELIYRGLVGKSEFQIDVIIPELDPLVSYPYRLKISEAKKSFRLANRYYQLIAARKAALQLKLINPLD
jgi:hypothetical protein